MQNQFISRFMINEILQDLDHKNNFVLDLQIGKDTVGSNKY